MEDVKAYYDKKAGNYDDVFDTLYFRVYDAVTWKYLEPYVPTTSEKLVLDAGGGTGRWAIRMAGKGCGVVLMDLSEEMLKVAAQKIQTQSLHGRVKVEKGDITKTNYPDEAFDMILCEHALFVFKEPDIVLREFHRILKKKSRLVISAQNRYAQSLSSLSDSPSTENMDTAMKILLREKYSCMKEDGTVKIYTWTPDEFRKMLERNGFHVEKMVGKGITMPLRISKEFFMRRKYSADFFNRVLQFEFALCEKLDALALAGHLQAVAQKPQEA